jgi:hypothetical protein
MKGGKLELIIIHTTCNTFFGDSDNSDTFKIGMTGVFQEVPIFFLKVPELFERRQA